MKPAELTASALTVEQVKQEQDSHYIVIPHFIYFQIHCTSVKFNKAPVSNKLTFIASDSLIPGRCMLS